MVTEPWLMIQAGRVPRVTKMRNAQTFTYKTETKEATWKAWV
jgi:hypothetical protein